MCIQLNNCSIFVKQNKENKVMEAQEFKTKIKEIKDLIKGVKLQIVQQRGFQQSYDTLNEFGKTILEKEKQGYSFKLYWLSTDGEREYNHSFEELIEKLKEGVVTFISFMAYVEYKNECERVQNSGRLD
jgi:hypothetical protein